MYIYNIYDIYIYMSHMEWYTHIYIYGLDIDIQKLMVSQGISIETEPLPSWTLLYSKEASYTAVLKSSLSQLSNL